MIRLEILHCSDIQNFSPALFGFYNENYGGCMIEAFSIIWQQYLADCFQYTDLYTSSAVIPCVKFTPTYPDDIYLINCSITNKDKATKKEAKGS